MSALCHAMLHIISATAQNESDMNDAVESTCCTLVAGMDEILKEPRETLQ